MLRVLDLDLDFFVEGVAHWRTSDGERLDGEEYPPWNLDQAFLFLKDQCKLDGSLPGSVVENHGELFWAWKNAIATGLFSPPFDVTHVDAHADLGLGDSGYVYLMTDLLYREPVERTNPEVGETRLNDGNYLAFAIACRWLSRLSYIYNDEGGGDLMSYHLEGFDRGASNIQLKAMRKSEIDRLHGLLAARTGEIKVDRHEPLVPFHHGSWRDFQAEHPFDAICLARSPGFTPPAADAVFDAIRDSFIEELAV